MESTHSEAFFNSEIAFLVLQIGKINTIIANSQKEDDNLGIWQYTRHRQQFIDQLNVLLGQYQLQIGLAA